MKTLLPEINSADKRFHNGNPATGEQGTRVTDTWLNDVQDRIRDVQEEAHYVLQQAGFTPKAETKTQLYQAIVKIIEDNRQSATTKNAGIVQLNSATNSTSETEAATPKAVKTLKDLLDSVSRNQANYIPNSKKLSSVSSASSDTVATSVAVKTAYDKGVEGLNKANAAQTAANNANNNANGRVSKSGDTITGQLRIKHPNVLNGLWSQIQLETKQGYWRWEVHPDSHNANDRRFNVVYVDASGSNSKYLSFPTIGDSGQVVAYQNWVSEQIGNAKSLLEGIISNKANRSDFIRTWYPKHYKGAEVFKIRPLGLMITTMSLGTVNSGVYKLPEAYTGFKIASAIDAGGTRLVTADVTRNNEVTIRMSGTGIAVDLIIIGYKGDI